MKESSKKDPITEADLWKKNYYEASFSRDRWQLKCYAALTGIDTIVGEIESGGCDEISTIAVRLKKIAREIKGTE